MTEKQIISKLKEVKELCENIKQDRNFEKTLLKELDKINDIYYHITDNYFNLKIYIINHTNKELYSSFGMVRVYKSKTKYHVQLWTPCRMEYSGISTFPSAKY